MPDFDLEPHEYTVKGRKEPILNKGWWLTLLLLLAVIVFGQVVVRPITKAIHAYMMDITD